MKNLKRALAIVLTALMVQSIVASSVYAADTSQIESSVDSTYLSSNASEAQDISLDKGELSLYNGDTQQLNATLIPEDAQDTITWTSSDTSIATVDSNGIVTASKTETGTAIITATTSNGKTANCNVTVSVAPEYVYLNKSEVTIIQGETYTLIPSVTPTNASTTYSWSIDDNTIATIDENGKITAKKVGTTTVAVTTANGKGTLCTVNVINVPKTIRLNKTELSLRPDETYTFTKTVSPTNATATYKWSSSDTSVATVDQNGKVTAKALGTTVISVKADNGVTGECILTVCNYPTSVSLNKTELDLVVGKYEDLTPQLQPENAYTTYKWTSSDTKVATVTTNGRVAARGVGTATITLTTDNGKTTTCKVNVSAVPTSIKFNEISANEALPMRKDETFQLTTTVSPANASTSYKWESNNPDIVSVDENGLLTAKSLGTATITVITDNNLQASCEVVVYKTPTSISLNASEITLNSTETFQIIPNVQPADSYYELISIVSDKSIFTINTEGLITAKNPGTATLTVKTDTGLSAECIINVTAIPKALEITNKQPIQLKVGGTVTLGKKVTPSNAVTTYEWISSNENVATVNANGVVTAKAIGKTEITVTTENGISTSCIVEVCPDPDSIVLDKTSIDLKNNEYYTLVPTLTPSNALTTYKWTSSDTNIATVSSVGKVIGKNTGTATITVTTANGKTAECTVNVIAKPTGISFVEKSYYLREGEKGSLTIKLTPTSAVTEYTWTSSDTEVATVDENGVITAIKAGTTTITVKTDNDKTTSKQITVYKMPTSVKLAQSFMSMAVGQDFTFTPILEPDNSIATYTWESSNTDIAEIDGEGKVTAKTLGTTTITVTDDLGHTATCKITVFPAPESVKLNAKSVVTTTKNGYQLKPTVTPSNAYTFYTWESSNPDVATVSDSGRVRTLSEGTAIITVKTSNNVTASCTFTVTDSPVSASLDNTDITMDIGDTKTLTPSVKPSKAITNYTWSSSNTNVATVSSTGTIKAVSNGIAFITVRTDNGQTATCVVTVGIKPESVKLSKTSMSLEPGRKYRITPSLTPENAVTEYTWSSNNTSVATVNKYGNITAVSEGTAIITVKTTNGKTASCTVNVAISPESVALLKTDLTLKPDSKYLLKTTLTPENATTTYTWSSSDTSVATVNKYGNVTAISNGTAVITVKTANGKTATCIVNVVVPPTSVTLSKTSLTLKTGAKYKIVPNLNPTYATTTYTWTSSNTSVATVNKNGNITAVGEGTAIVTVKTSNGKTDKCVVTVK